MAGIVTTPRPESSSPRLRATPYSVPVHCTHVYPDGGRCTQTADDHIHQPPCANGNDERHHEYAPPRSVLLDIGGRIKRVRLDR